MPDPLEADREANPVHDGSSEQASHVATAAVLRCLNDMLAAPDDEIDILCDGACYCGNRRIAHSTVRRLLRCLSIRDVSDGGTERYVVKRDIASQIVARPVLADEIEAAVLAQRRFDVQRGRVIFEPHDGSRPHARRQSEVDGGGRNQQGDEDG